MVLTNHRVTENSEEEEEERDVLNYLLFVGRAGKPVRIIEQLFPLYGSRWFRGDVVNDAIHAFDFVDDSVGNRL
jgi:hypothetical protein